MNKKCPQCQKENNAEIRICTCGYQFFSPILEMEEFFPQLKKPPQSAGSIITIGLFSIFGLVLIIALVEPSILTSFFKNNVDNKEKTAFVNSNQSTLVSETENAPTNHEARLTIQGKVTSVKSGNQITVMDNLTETEYHIRLAGIKDPEPSDLMAKQAHRHLTEEILNKEVLALLSSAPADGLHTGKVLYKNKDVGFQQIKSGYVKNDEISASVLTDFDLNLYRDAENEAKTSKIGVWSEDGSIPEENNHEPIRSSIPTENPPVSVSEKVTLKTERASTSINQSESTGNSSEIIQSRENSTKKQSVKAKSKDSITAAPTARCRDGSLSTSISRSGACSSHGGVSEWLGSAKSDSNSKANTQQTMLKYIRGSRGGCYFINGSGSKTYVDKSLCN